MMLTLIFTFVPFATVWAAAREFSPGLWLAALGLFIAGHAAAAAKWRLLIGDGVSYRQAFRAHLAGLAANLALPGVAGGDVVRAGLVMNMVHDKGKLAVGSLADRLLDTLGLILIALAGAYFAWRPEMNAGSGLGWIMLAALALVSGAFLAMPALDRMLMHREVTGKIARIIGRMVSAAADLSKQPGRLFVCLGISMMVQCLFVGINIAFARAAHVDAPVAAWFFAWTSAKIIAIAPISLGGLGVREASMAGLLKPFGADPGQVVAIGLIWQSVLYVSGAIGFLIQLRPPAPENSRTESSR
jgi:uncharacterized protein (TIRG00374 family)